jgi:hypothetical protein
MMPQTRISAFTGPFFNFSNFFSNPYRRGGGGGLERRWDYRRGGGELAGHLQGLHGHVADQRPHPRPE